VRQAVDHAEELDDRAGPAMRQHQCRVVRAGTALMQDVDGVAVDLGHELREAVDRGLLGTPVEAVDPIVAEHPQETRVGAGGPWITAFCQCRHRLPIEALHLPADGFEPRVRQRDPKWCCSCHVRDPSAPILPPADAARRTDRSTAKGCIAAGADGAFGICPACHGFPGWVAWIILSTHVVPGWRHR
jgi:hypothetical protein